MYIADPPTDALSRIAPRRRGSGALLRVALRPEDGGFRLLSGALHLGGKELKPTSPRRYAYPNLVLAELWLPRTDALRLTAHLPDGGQLDLPRIGTVCFPEMDAHTYRRPSRANLGYFSSDWPVAYSNWYSKAHDDDHLEGHDQRLLGPGLPLYPNERTAVLSFVHGYTRGN